MTTLSMQPRKHIEGTENFQMKFPLTAKTNLTVLERINMF